MDNLPSDVIRYMALELDIPELFALCKTSKKLDNELCKNNNFWLSKLKNEYDLVKSDIPARYSPRTYYLYIRYEVLKGNLEDELDNQIRKGNLKLVKLLVKHGAMSQNSVSVPFLVASRMGYLDILDYLFPLTEPKYYPIGIISAADVGRLDIIKYLVSKGVDVHYDNDKALIFASEEGHLDVVKYLVEEHNADIHSKDDRSVKRAKSRGYNDVVNYLLSKGANL